MPRKTYKSLNKLSLGNLILALEAELDSIQLQMQPRYYHSSHPYRKKMLKLRRQVLNCLAIARRLQARFPQNDYTLNRCRYSDELPHKPMSKAKHSWYQYKREQKEKRTQSRLNHFVDWSA